MGAELDAYLNDPAHFVKRPGILVFNSHTRMFGDTAVSVTDPELYEWAEEGQATERANGVAGILRVGHIRPHEPDETKQPPTAGVFKNMRVERCGPENKLGVVVDEYVRKEWAARIPDFPHRSVEAYRGLKKITGVAMLARDPFLPGLGVNLYAADRPPDLYSFGEPVVADPATPPAPPAAAPAASPQLSPEDKAAMDKIVAYLQGLGFIPKVPANPADGPATPPNAPPSPETMALGLKPELYAALRVKADAAEAETARLKAAVAQLQAGQAAKDTDALLHSLVLERYSFDAAEERAAMLATDESGRQRRAATIRQYHSRQPADQMIDLYAGAVEGPAGAQREAASLHARAMEHLRAHPGTTLEAAYESVAKK